jgi:hypothetical protein
LRDSFIKSPPAAKRVGYFAEDVSIASFIDELNVSELQLTVEEDDKKIAINKKATIARKNFPWEKIVKWKKENKINFDFILALYRARNFTSMQIIPEFVNNFMCNKISPEDIQDDFDFELKGRVYRLLKDIPFELTLKYMDEKVENEFRNNILYLYIHPEEYKKEIRQGLISVFSRLFDVEKQVLRPTLHKKLSWVYTRYFTEAVLEKEISAESYLDKGIEDLFKLSASIYSSSAERKRNRLVNLVCEESVRKQAMGIALMDAEDDRELLSLNEVEVSPFLLEELLTGKLSHGKIKKITTDDAFKDFIAKQDAISIERLNKSNDKAKIIDEIDRFRRMFTYRTRIPTELDHNRAIRIIQNLFIFPGKCFYIFPSAIWEQKAGGITMGTNAPLTIAEGEFLSMLSNIVFIRPRIRERILDPIKFDTDDLDLEIKEELLTSFWTFYPKIRFILLKCNDLYKEYVNRTNSQGVIEILKSASKRWLENVLQEYFLSNFENVKHKGRYYIEADIIQELFREMIGLFKQSFSLAPEEYKITLDKWLNNFQEKYFAFLPNCRSDAKWKKALLLSDSCSNKVSGKFKLKGLHAFCLESDLVDNTFDKIRSDYRYCAIFVHADKISGSDDHYKLFTELYSSVSDSIQIGFLASSNNADVLPRLDLYEYFVKIMVKKNQNWAKIFGTCLDFIDTKFKGHQYVSEITRHDTPHVMNLFVMLMQFVLGKKELIEDERLLRWTIGSIFLHDIGYCAEKRTNIPEALWRADRQEYHGVYSSKMIMEKYKEFGLNEDDAKIISLICKYHQSNAPFDDKAVAKMENERKTPHKAYLENGQILTFKGSLKRLGIDEPSRQAKIIEAAAILRLFDAFAVKENQSRLTPENKENMSVDEIKQKFEGKLKEFRNKVSEDIESCNCLLRDLESNKINIQAEIYNNMVISGLDKQGWKRIVTNYIDFLNRQEFHHKKHSAFIDVEFINDYIVYTLAEDNNKVDSAEMLKIVRDKHVRSEWNAVKEYLFGMGFKGVKFFDAKGDLLECVNEICM